MTPCVSLRVLRVVLLLRALRNNDAANWFMDNPLLTVHQSSVPGDGLRLEYEPMGSPSLLRAPQERTMARSAAWRALR